MTPEDYETEAVAAVKSRLWARGFSSRDEVWKVAVREVRAALRADQSRRLHDVASEMRELLRQIADDGCTCSVDNEADDGTYAHDADCITAKARDLIERIEGE